MGTHSWSAWMMLYENCSELINHSNKSKEKRSILYAELMFGKCHNHASSELEMIKTY